MPGVSAGTLYVEFHCAGEPVEYVCVVVVSVEKGGVFSKGVHRNRNASVGG